MTRALDLLLAFAELAPPVDLATLARHLELHPTSAYRYVESLRSRHLVEQAPDGGYELGSAVFELSSAFLRGQSIWGEAPDLARRLAEEVNETANVGILSNGQVVYIAIANGQHELGIQSFPGTRHPAHCTALGKVLLADRPRNEAAALFLSGPPARLTANTITDLSRFEQELEEVRRLGYSLDDEERAPGVICIGAPIRDHTGQTVAALSVSGPAFRISERGVDTVARLVTRAAGAASMRLGALRTDVGPAGPALVR